MTTAMTISKTVAENGRHIFAYNNIRTNQVVYSLDRTLNNNQVLKQLPYLGKNTVPATLRKDVWRPLYFVTFPSAPQGLHAFRKLREYRKLHEHSWEKGSLRLTHPGNRREEDDPEPDIFGGPTEKDERKAAKKKLKKLRGKLIMDQKANSIADLAAVLQEQEELGTTLMEKRRQEEERESARIREEVLSLTEEAQKGGVERLDRQIAEQERRVEGMEQERKQGAAVSAAGAQKRPSRHELRKQEQVLGALKLKKAKMLAAKSQYETQTRKAVRDAEAQGRMGNIEVETEFTIPDIFRSTPKSSSNTPKRGSERKAAQAANTPLYSTEGVTIRWNNIMDAEFAESWPEAVKHDVTGLVRHTAPAPGAEPIFDAALRNAVNFRPAKRASLMRVMAQDGAAYGGSEVPATQSAPS